MQRFLTALQPLKTPFFIIRTFKSHSNQILTNTGRSVVVKGRPQHFSVSSKGTNVVGAYAQLRDILNESKVRDVIRAQQRHERTHDKKRRIKKQRLFDDYLGFMKKKVELAYDLKKKTEQENADAGRI